MAIDFDQASSQNINMGTSPIFDAGVSSVCIMCWFKTTIGAASDASLVNKGASQGVGAKRYKLNFDGNGFIKFEIDDDGASGDQLTETTTNARDGNWHHVVGIRDSPANEIRIYEDGEFESSLALPVGYGNIDDSRAATIGSALDLAGAVIEPFTGSMADVRYYLGRVISAAEIKHIYNSFGHDQVVQNLTARYMMNEEAPGALVGAVTDSGPNGLDGTPGGGPTYSGGGELNFIDRSMR